MERDVGLVYLPPVNGLPGVEERHLLRLRREVPDFDWIPCADRDEFFARLPEARVALVWAFGGDWLERAPKLQLIATPAAGRDWIHVQPGPALELLFGTFHGVLMAETVAGMMLAFTRGIKDSFDRRDETWPRVEVAGGMRLLRGSHAVILGFGHIGKWIGRILVSLGVRVTGVNRTDTARPDYFTPEDGVVTLSQLDSIMPEADHFVVALPSGAGTDNIVDAGRLGLLRREAYVYNVGRGNAIDMPALIDALEGGRLAGAGLDVFPEEPLPADAPIRRCRRAILLPHVSAFAPVYMDLYFDEIVPRLKGMARDSRADEGSGMSRPE